MYKILLLILGLALTMEGRAQSVYRQNFDAAEIEQLLEQPVAGLELVPAADGGRCLKLAPEVNQVTLKPITVSPLHKYKLTFRGRIEAANTVEKNDRAHMEVHRTYGRFAPAYQVLFLDAEGKEIKSKFHGGNGFVLTSEWYEYVNIFHLPETTEMLKVQFLPKNRPLFIDDLALAPAGEEDTVNCNPAWEYGELNYCGWTPARDGRLYKRPDGVTVFKSGYGGGSPYIPLREGVNYRIYARGEKQVSGSSVTMNYYDEKGARLGNRFLLRPAPEGGHVDLTPPPKTRYGRISMYNVILEEFRITELNGGGLDGES